jgi:N-acetylglucosaminyldiphosphoundecaprenol N-acetyl-beta-D-mannosaminyltransferase
LDTFFQNKTTVKNERINIGGIPIDAFESENHLNGIIKQNIEDDKKVVILHANGHLIELANTSAKWLKEYFNKKVDYVFCDGKGIILAAKITKQLLPVKITYNVWFWDFVGFCNENNYSIYLLGAKPEVVGAAALKLEELNPGVKIFYHHGYFDKSSESEDNLKVIKDINKKKPHILLVCFGMPLQEKWLKENSHKLNVNIFLVGGGALDFISGYAKMTPKIWDKLYLEWLFRLLNDPKRLWKRYLIGNFRFLYHVIRERFFNKNN